MLPRMPALQWWTLSLLHVAGPEIHNAAPLLSLRAMIGWPLYSLPADCGQKWHALTHVSVISGKCNHQLAGQVFQLQVSQFLQVPTQFVLGLHTASQPHCIPCRLPQLLSTLGHDQRYCQPWRTDRSDKMHSRHTRLTCDWQCDWQYRLNEVSGQRFSTHRHNHLQYYLSDRTHQSKTWW